MREELLGWISFTCVCLAFAGSYLAVKAWELGRDYIIKDNYGRRLNKIEKWFDGLITLLKI